MFLESQKASLGRGRGRSCSSQNKGKKRGEHLNLNCNGISQKGEKKIFSSPNIISGVLRGDGTLPLADWHPFFFFVKKVITHSILGGNGGGTFRSITNMA